MLFIVKGILNGPGQIGTQNGFHHEASDADIFDLFLQERLGISGAKYDG
jgi:hypothetical protein